MKLATFFKDRRIQTSLVGIGADLLLSSMKLGLALVTGSAALLADAYHSGADFIVSLVLFCGLALRFSSEQGAEDREGAHQHRQRRAQKVEAILGLGVSLVILYVPVELIFQLQNQSSEDLKNLWVGIIGVLVIMGVLIFMSRLKSHVGRETDSIALEADGYHSYIDLFSTAAVLASLVGMMVGLYIDEIVAIIIAVLIAVAGIELFVSAMRSLLKQDDLEAISLFDVIAVSISKIPFGKAVLLLFERARGFINTWRWLVLFILAISYLGTGIKVVPHGYQGAHLRFNEVLGAPLEPGLHLLLPAPFDQLTSIPHGEIYEVQIGSRVGLDDSQAQSRLWRELQSTAASSDAAAYIATADESLVDIRLNIQFRIENPTETSLLVDDPSAFVKSYAQGALWEQVAIMGFDKVTSAGDKELVDRLSKTLSQRLNELDLQIDIVHAKLQSVQPPATVVTTYRDLINADQERQQRINVAIAKSLQDLPDSRAKISAQSADIQAQAAEDKLSAEAEGSLISRLAEVHKSLPEAYEFNARMDASIAALQDRKLTVADPRVNPRDFQAWLKNQNANTHQRNR